MKEKITSVLMLVLILTNTLSMAFIIRPSWAENDFPNEDFMEKTGETAFPNEANKLYQAEGFDSNWYDIFERKPDAGQDKNLERLNQTLRNGGDSWDFNATSGWSEFAYVDGNKTRLIVGVNGGKPNNLIELEEIAGEHGGKIVNTVSIGSEVRAVVVELTLASVATFSEKTRVLDLVTYIEPNMKFNAAFIPNDPYWSYQWGPQKIEADWAWNTTIGNRSIIAAVIDTGIDYTHPDLAANYVSLGYDWVNNDTDPWDDHGHGTHCAGIIAAVLNNSIGIAGIAQVSVMAEKGLNYWGWGTEDWLASAIAHAADMGADIISMSWGGYFHSELIYEAIKYAYDSGVLLVAAAGNEATSTKSYPAGYEEVIAVAATDQNDYTAWWSNFGDWIEVAAPGVSVYSTVPWGYESWSGTSMACPHVAGVAVLVWSAFPNKTRDWVRLWLRYTSDDLGDPSFDIYYGYGRINARKAVEWAPPEHELIAYEWTTPPYVEPEASAAINSTILNFGESDETDVMVQLFADDIPVDSVSIALLASGNSTTISLLWNPTIKGLYNVTLYVVPVPGEVNVENNVLSKRIYVGFPVKAVVLHSAGNVFGDIITNWQVLNNEWYLFGDTMVFIDYTTLNKEDITYEDIAATESDMLIISCAFDPYSGWEFTDSEIEAIERYVHEGHGLIATAGTLYYWVPNNNKLAPLFGLNETIMWDATGTDLLHLVNTTHPLFANVPNPLVFPMVGTALPYDGRWDSNELVGGEYLALGHYEESAIVTYRGLVYVSPWIEVIPPYYHHHLQLLYNAITWSCYQKPEHELIVSLEVPKALKPSQSVLLNATVSNMGLSNETDIVLQLLINGEVVNSANITELLIGDSYMLNYTWTPTIEGFYNVTAYAMPVPGEDNILNNVKSARVIVSTLVIALCKNADPWNYPSNEEALNFYGIPYVVLRSSDFGNVDLSVYRKVVIASDQDQSFYVAMKNYRWWFEDYVCNGGVLEIHAADWGWHGGHWVGTLPGGLQWASYYSDFVTIVDPWHPVVTTPNLISDAELDYWHASVHGYFSVYPVDSHIIIIEDSTRQPAYLEFEYGAGSIVASSQTLEWAYRWQYSRILENSLLYMPRYEHDLAVSLDAPKFLEPSKSVLLNATVRNCGLNNETDVELQLLINDTLVNAVLIPGLLTGASYTLSHTWTPTVEGTYNITAYASPVENETILANNIATKFATVTQPLIHPIEGQYANYTIYYVDPSTSEEIFGGLLNFTYLNYVSPYQINVTMWMRGPYNYTQSGWMIVNIFTRMVERDSGIDWTGMWYPGWIETNVTIGSTVNLLWGNATIVDNEVIYVGGRPIDCWEIELEQYGWVYTFWYDKASGLWIGMKSASPYEVVYLTLTATNIPLGFMYEHDLTVTLDAPSTLPLDESSILNATIYNMGLSNETNVTLQLIINGTVVDNVTIGELPVSERYTLSYPWTPTHTGLYNVTAYAPPALGEEYIANNIVTKGVGVFFYARLYIPHEWVGGGVPMGWHADDASWRYTLPFDFPFYGIYYRTIYISSNGLITFLGPDTSWGNSVPWLAQKLAIAPAWDDWVTYDPYDIYIWQNSTHVGIRWYVRAYGSSTVANFEAILSVEGIIQFNYEYNDGYVSATIGISNGAGHILAEDLTDLNYINTIMFVPFRVERDVAIISVEPSANEVTAGDTVDVVVVVENQGNFTENFTVRAYASFQGNVTETAYVSSLNSTRIYLDPSDYIFSADMVSVGYRFNVTVRVADVEDLALWQVKMYYNDDIINVTRWFEPAWDPEYVFYGKTTISPPYYYEHVGPGIGFVIGGACLLPWPPEQEPFYGGGKLCIIEFEILAIPAGGEAYSCVLNINNVDTYLMDSQRMRIPGVVKEDGYYELSPREYVIGAMNITDLAPGEIVTLIFTWNTTDVPPGYYLICAKASRVPYEVDTEDNVFYDGIITVLPAMFHDVAVTEVSVSLNMVYQGWNVSINVTVANFGNATETFIVTVYYDNTVLATESVQDLEPNATLRLCFIWDTTDVPYCHNFTIKAVASMVLGETNTANNEYADGWVKIKIMGDINCDDKVDMVDIAIACEAFGSYTGHPRWNPDADLDQNGISDMQDIGMVLLNFGTC